MEKFHLASRILDKPHSSVHSFSHSNIHSFICSLSAKRQKRNQEVSTSFNTLRVSCNRVGRFTDYLDFSSNGFRSFYLFFWFAFCHPHSSVKPQSRNRHTPQLKTNHEVCEAQRTPGFPASERIPLPPKPSFALSDVNGSSRKPGKEKKEKKELTKGKNGIRQCGSSSCPRPTRKGSVGFFSLVWFGHEKDTEAEKKRNERLRECRAWGE